MQINITKYVKKTASLNLFFWSILWLMLITVVGTIEQKNIGLFKAQEKYFSSFYFTVKGFPLPGGGLVILIMIIGLLAQLSFKTSYKLNKKIGVALTHIGAIILLSGSLLTHFFGTEGSLVLRENEKANYIRDYKLYEIAINAEDGTRAFSYEFPYNQEGSLLKNRVKISQGLELVQLTSTLNCGLISNALPRENEVGFAKLFKFTKVEKKSENEICIEAIFEHNHKTLIYRIFPYMPKLQSFELSPLKGTLHVQNKRVYIPFHLKLVDFEKKFHQGTMISKSFKSHVEIQDGDLVFSRTIEMNSPLRYKDYTFYQSSFSENSNGEISELAVVKNTADWFPYVSSFILCLGVLIHLAVKISDNKSGENV